ncbi:MAG: hypothetical protein U0R65_08335 [Candidatus Nanopelagicales bacterium]|jgi:hypothetical protein
MKTITRVAVAVAAVAVTGTGAVGSAQAADTPPLTYAQIQSDPTMIAVEGQVKALIAGDFTMAGKQLGPGGTVITDEKIVHRGSLYRTWIKQGRNSVVVITDGKQTCKRPVTKSAPNSYAGDVRSRWVCVKGSDKLTTSEIAAVTPLGVASLLDSTTSGAAQFTPTAVPTGGVQVVLSANGNPVGSYTVAGPAGGPFTLSVTAGTGASAYQTVAFTTTAGATQKIPALAKLKR